LPTQLDYKANTFTEEVVFHFYKNHGNFSYISLRKTELEIEYNHIKSGISRKLSELSLIKYLYIVLLVKVIISPLS